MPHQTRKPLKKSGPTCRRSVVHTEKTTTDKIPLMTPKEITWEEVNTKASGTDKIQNYWYKQFVSTQDKIAVLFNNPGYWTS